jgi:hypothetical protein
MTCMRSFAMSKGFVNMEAKTPANMEENID